MHEPSEQEKEFWKGATDRRKANAIRLGRLCVYVDKEQLDAFLELYQDTWLARWGKTKATDALIAAMCEYEAKFQDLKELVLRRKADKKRKKK